MTGGGQTPLMQQYREIKARHHDAILFFRMGEFYEMFYEDAEAASRILGLTLTSRNNGGAADVPLAGVPAKAASDYVRRLVQHGLRVAICEQMEDPRAAKGVVRREVVETITPGAAFADDLLDHGRGNYVCAVQLGAPGTPYAGLAAADVSTGEFRLIIVPASELEPVLARLAPRELVVPTDAGGTSTPASSVRGSENALVTEREAWEFDAGSARDELVQQYRVHSLEGLGIDMADSIAVGAAGALLRYLRELQPAGLPQLARPIVERPGGSMPLDEMTRRNLELVESLRGGDGEGTLLSVIDRTRTPMGARMLRQWILAPLTDRPRIEERLDAVGALESNAIANEAIRAGLDGVRDIERLAAKAAADRGTPRELRALGDSLWRVPAVEVALRSVGRAGALAPLLDHWDACLDVAEEIRSVVVERAPVAVGDDPTIAVGVDPELDSLRAVRDGGKDAIARIQTDERNRTGIQSLKVGFNKVFGYYIEVSKANLHLIPPDFQRRQTIANG
ncbi:MAG TPA: DNA mismatch repair protein MutS, partial [Gemmatimonadaceae bacterium]|nr:DNA mismatch repair protein MutS [Gemmatimonadaceae bacterium]